MTHHYLSLSAARPLTVSYLVPGRKERGLLDPAKRDPDERYCSLGDKVAEMGRYGQKTGVCTVALFKSMLNFFFVDQATLASSWPAKLCDFGAISSVYKQPAATVCLHSSTLSYRPPRVFISTHLRCFALMHGTSLHCNSATPVVRQGVVRLREREPQAVALAGGCRSHRGASNGDRKVRTRPLSRLCTTV